MLYRFTHIGYSHKSLADWSMFDCYWHCKLPCSLLSPLFASKVSLGFFFFFIFFLPRKSLCFNGRLSFCLWVFVLDNNLLRWDYWTVSILATPFGFQNPVWRNSRKYEIWYNKIRDWELWLLQELHSGFYTTVSPSPYIAQKWMLLKMNRIKNILGTTGQSTIAFNIFLHLDLCSHTLKKWLALINFFVSRIHKLTFLCQQVPPT